MIHPTDEQLLAGIATALKDTVLPDLARGSTARKQLQAAIETLRRMAFAAPGRDAALATDNADMAEVVRQIGEILAEAGHSPPPNLPPQGGGIRKNLDLPQPEKALPPSDRRSLSGEAQKPPSAAGGGLGGGECLHTHLVLQQKLADLQTTIPPALAPQITPLLAQLYARMTDRALALTLPPMPRTPRTPE